MFLFGCSKKMAATSVRLLRNIYDIMQEQSDFYSDSSFIKNYYK